jgi:predicted O-methyltransferase YrrM
MLPGTDSPGFGSCRVITQMPSEVVSVAAPKSISNLKSAVKRPLKDARRKRRENWLQRRSSSFEHLAKRIGPELWAETSAWAEDFEAGPHPAELQALQERGVGGAGHIRALYFLTRWLRPERAVETGVSAGWSSAAVLQALECNGGGRLWSSDLNYARRGIGDFGAYNGIMVNEGLRHRWTLHTDGDRANLPAILGDLDGEIQLFHYDSDKSYEGREWAFGQVIPRLSQDAVVVVDDIDDNDHFIDLVRRLGWAHRVYPKDHKFIGLLAAPACGLLDDPAV